MIIGLRCEMEDRRPAVNFADDSTLGSCSPYRRATVTLSDDASVGSYSTWSTWGSPALSEEELAARRAARRAASSSSDSDVVVPNVDHVE